MGLGEPQPEVPFFLSPPPIPIPVLQSPRVLALFTHGLISWAPHTAHEWAVPFLYVGSIMSKLSAQWWQSTSLGILLH